MAKKATMNEEILGAELRQVPAHDADERLKRAFELIQRASAQTIPQSDLDGLSNKHEKETENEQ